jgi:hypothetical protein
MKKLIYVLTMAIFSANIWAKDLELKWAPMPESKRYEIEVAQDSTFSEYSLVRQEDTKENQYKTDLPPGVYFVRIRGVDTKGKPGPWGQPIKRVLSGDKPQIVEPSMGAKIESGGPKTALVVEWKTVKNAEDYVIEISRPFEPAKTTHLSVANSYKFLGDKEGRWKISVAARVRGQVVSEFGVVEFDLSYKKLPQPRLLFPKDGEILTSFESYNARWVKAFDGEYSTVEIVRIGGPNGSGRLGVIGVNTDTETSLPPLPKGQYQLTVTDYLTSDEAKSPSASQTVAFKVEDDPYGFHSQYAGITWNFIELFPMWGGRSLTNDQLPESTSLSDIGNDPQLAVTSRIRAEIYGHWGMETKFVFKQFKFQNANELLNGKPDISSVTLKHHRLDLGATYFDPRLGVYWPLKYKGMLSYKRLSTLNPASATNDRLYEPSGFGLLGLVAGAEIRWFGWRSRYDFSSEIQTELPLFTDKGTLFGRGSPRFLIPYSLDLDLRVRRKLGDFHRLSFGFRVHTELLSIGEKPALHMGVGERDSRTVWREFSWGPLFSWDWDL